MNCCDTVYSIIGQNIRLWFWVTKYRYLSHATEDTANRKAKKAVEYSAVCDWWYFTKNPGDACGLHIFPPKIERIPCTAKNFSFFQNFQRQVFKQHSKTRVLTSIRTSWKSKLRKVIQNEIKQTKKFGNLLTERDTNPRVYTHLNVAKAKTDSQQQAR